MAFSQSIADEVFVKCGRHCCLCGTFAGQKMELHHIKQIADGGDDSINNCIPLCLNCHAEVKAYNPHHPKGRKYTEQELKGHRDRIYSLYSYGTELNGNLHENKDGEGLFTKDDKDNHVSWGYKSQDMISPLAPGMIVLVAGHTEMKKSTYVHHVVNHNITQGRSVVYICLKDGTYATGCGLVAEHSRVKLSDIRTGNLTEKDWKRIAMSLSDLESHRIKLLSEKDINGESDRVVSFVQHSGADIVVLDDFQGLFLHSDVEIEQFMYQLKRAALNSGAIVFIIYNLLMTKRMDKRPMLSDFPSENHYRVCDIVHFIFQPSVCYQDADYLKEEKIEIFVAKGFSNKNNLINMLTPKNVTGIFEYE